MQMTYLRSLTVDVGSEDYMYFEAMLEGAGIPIKTREIYDEHEQELQYLVYSFTTPADYQFAELAYDRI